MGKNNKHRTSANVDYKFFNALSFAAAKYNKTQEQIFKDLVELVIQAIQCGHVTGILTEYQDHKPEHWETLYYSIDENEIEIFGTSRQKYKLSISKLAFIGFLLFWRLLLLKYMNKLFNSENCYDFNSYDEYRKLLSNYVVYFKKRLNLIQKE